MKRRKLLEGCKAIPLLFLAPFDIKGESTTVDIMKLVDDEYIKMKLSGKKLTDLVLGSKEFSLLLEAPYKPILRKYKGSVKEGYSFRYHRLRNCPSHLKGYDLSVTVEEEEFDTLKFNPQTEKEIKDRIKKYGAPYLIKSNT